MDASKFALCEKFDFCEEFDLFSKSRTLTDYEIEAKVSNCDLTDGHASQDLTETQFEIIERVSEIWRASETKNYQLLVDEFCSSFSRLNHIPNLMQFDPELICPTASNSIELVAAAMAAHQMTVRIVEPTFDNLALLFKRRGVRTLPLPLAAISQIESREQVTEILADYPADAYLIVLPNNPTGLEMTEYSFQCLAEEMSDRSRTLILDNSFRIYRRENFDDFKILLESKVPFISFEDTGKTWPTQELKASIVSCSSDYRQLLSMLYREVFLAASNFSLSLLTEFCDATHGAGISSEIWEPLEKRRKLLREQLDGTSLQIDPTALDSKISVEWLDCSDTGLDDVEVVERLRSIGLGLLPGRQFFWNSSGNASSQNNVRISLMRKARVIDAALNTIKEHSLSSLFEKKTNLADGHLSRAVGQ